MKRPILMLYGELRHGGTETLIVRAANHLVGGGREVAVCVPGGELLARLDRRVEVILSSSHNEAIEHAAGWLGKRVEPLLISFDPISLGLGLSVEVSVPENVGLVHISGVYHPQSFFMNAERADRRRINAMLAKAVGNERLFFMNEECRQSHAQEWNRDLSASFLVPLPIDLRSADWSASAEKPLSILSVGRLVDFKRYNHGAGEIAERLAEKGTEVRWTIHGDGEDRPAVEHALTRSGSTRVELRDTLPYSKFLEEVARSQLFVGMGTAALEAAMAGTPTLVATVGEENGTHGFVHEMPFGNVGEVQPGIRPRKLDEEIAKYASLTQVEREGLSIKGRHAAMRYSLDAFETALDQLAQLPGTSTRISKQRAALIYKLVTRSVAVRAIRRLRDVMRNRMTLNL